MLWFSAEILFHMLGSHMIHSQRWSFLTNSGVLETAPPYEFLKIPLKNDGVP